MSLPAKPFFYFMAVFLALWILHSLFFGNQIEEVTYADFKKMVREQRIERCIVENYRIRGIYIKDDQVLKKYLAKRRQARLKSRHQHSTAKAQKRKKVSFWELFKQPKGRVRFSTVRVHDDPDLVAELELYGINFKGETESEFMAIVVPWLLPLGLLLVLWIFIMRRMNNYGRDVMSFGKSRAKITAETDTKTTFDDVAGCLEAKVELQEIVEFLKNPEKFEALGGKIPKGALLVGAPGTGKTLLARAVAGEAGVPFFSISGSEFVEMFVGVGASRVRDLFYQAKDKVPCIIFIDEIDAVGRHRGAGLGGGHDEREQTLNQLLTEMDGFEPNKGLIILAATNRPDILDPALLRPGRFDRQITIDQPDIMGREAILKVHARGKPLAPDVDLKVLAQRTPGFSGADLANVMNEAALLAARKDRDKIQMADITEAVERVMAGPERKSRIISPKEKRIIAFHEVGHALVSELHPYCDPVHKLSIIPRGPAMGYTMSLPEEDKYNLNQKELEGRICCLLAGRIAEEITFEEITTGAQNDLERVTDIARSMVTRYGMSKDLGPLAFEKEEGYVFLGKNFNRKSYFSGNTLNQIDEEVKRIVKECYEHTRQLLLENRDILQQVAERLLEVETMEGKELREFIAKIRALPSKQTSSRKSTATMAAPPARKPTAMRDAPETVAPAGHKMEPAQRKGTSSGKAPHEQTAESPAKPSAKPVETSGDSPEESSPQQGGPGDDHAKPPSTP